MNKTLSTIIEELQEKKSKLEKSNLEKPILETQKKEYEQRIKETLSGPVSKWKETEEYYKARDYQAKLNEIESKIKEIPEDAEKIIKEIGEKIDNYQNDRERIKNIPLYKDTEEWIAETLWSNPLYQYAQETNNTELINMLKERRLTPDEYTKFTEKMYNELFASTLKKKNKSTEIQTTPKIELPKWMSEKIVEVLSKNKEFTKEEIECFLKKELKKNGWEIMSSHIKNKFKERSNKATELLKEVISDFPKFKIIDNSEKKKETASAPISKNAKLIASLNPNIQQWKEATKNQLQRKLNKLAEETILERRIDWYIKILEKLWHQFSDKEAFKAETIDSIETHTSIQIEEGIIKAIKKIIGWNLNLRKTEAYWYRSFELGDKYDNRRILLYPNKEIMKICSHPEYDSIIDSRPPSDKR